MTPKYQTPSALPSCSVWVRFASLQAQIPPPPPGEQQAVAFGTCPSSAWLESIGIAESKDLRLPLLRRAEPLRAPGMGPSAPTARSRRAVRSWDRSRCRHRSL